MAIQKARFGHLRHVNEQQRDSPNTHDQAESELRQRAAADIVPLSFAKISADLLSHGDLLYSWEAMHSFCLSCPPLSR
jgi:hypothetical protein